MSHGLSSQEATQSKVILGHQRNRTAKLFVFPKKIRGFCQKLCSSLPHLLGHVADVAFYSGDDFLPAPVHGMSLQLRSGQSNECEANPKIIRRGISHRISSPNLRGIDSHRYSEAFKIRPWPWKTSTEKVDGHPYKE